MIVIMHEESEMLREVVVSGYTTLREAELTGFAGVLLGILRKNISTVRYTVNTSGALSDENAEHMKTALTNFKENSAYGKQQRIKAASSRRYANKADIKRNVSAFHLAYQEIDAEY